jgi:DNA-directed RNA polymerase subunit M/transcription elongation factor TFIIS
MSVTPQSDQEFCPDCGEFVDPTQMNEGTGFCFNCTPSLQSSITLSRIERWLAKYAEDIESEMQATNSTARLAIISVLDAHRATCIICGNHIKHGTYGRHFICNSTPICRKARRRYKYLIYDKGLTKEAALAVIKTPQEK